MVKGAIIVSSVRPTQKLAKYHAAKWYGEPWDYMKTIGYSCIRIQIKEIKKTCQSQDV